MLTTLLICFGCFAGGFVTGVLVYRNNKTRTDNLLKKG